MILSHRIAWLLENGQIPHDGSAHGICVCHRCDVRACCNPAHLFLGTNAENLQDMGAKGRAFAAHGEVNGSAKLTAAQVREIRSLYAAGGLFYRDLAAEFDVSEALIGQIIRRVIWKNV